MLPSAVIAQAFLDTPRHHFLPGLPLDRAYANQAVPTKIVDDQAVSSASQPAMIAIMLDQLALEPGHNVLEIGAGTGYNAALMSRLVGPTGHVVTVDIDADLVEGAQAQIDALGIDNVQVICADGGYGFADGAPYDRIILTVGALDITPHWWDQLDPGGRIVLPIEIGPGQKSVALDHVDDHLESVSIRDCGFIRLRGEYAGTEIASLPLGSEPGLEIVAPKALADQLDAETLLTWLYEKGTTWRTDVFVNQTEVIEGLGTWMMLRDPDLAQLVAYGEMAESAVVPPLLVRGEEYRAASTAILCDADGMAALTYAPGKALPAPLHVLQFGPDASSARHMVRSVQSWHEAGRPMLHSMRVRIYPQRDIPADTLGVYMLDKEWTHLVFDWPSG